MNCCETEMVDATSYFEFEQEEYRKLHPDSDLTPEMYLVKVSMTYFESILLSNPSGHITAVLHVSWEAR